MNNYKNAKNGAKINETKNDNNLFVKQSNTSVGTQKSNDIASKIETDAISETIKRNNEERILKAIANLIEIKQNLQPKMYERIEVVEIIEKTIKALQ
jgi:16S rRNA C1402 N4-methylase RsmH